VQVHKEGESTLAVLKKQVRMISDPQRGWSLMESDGNVRAITCETKGTILQFPWALGFHKTQQNDGCDYMF
jgi:hypothetical protein